MCIGHKHQGGAAVKHFAGLDVSLEETAIRVVDEEGRIVREARVASEPEALVAFVRGLGLALERIGLEACLLSAWLYEGLAAAGLPAVCIETRRAKAAMVKAAATRGLEGYRQVGLKAAAGRSPEARRESALKGVANRDREAHREAVCKALAARSPEARKEISRKATETRRRNREAAKGGAP